MARETKAERFAREQQEETNREAELAKWRKEELPLKMLYVVGKAAQLHLHHEVAPNEVSFSFYHNEYDCVMKYSISLEDDKWHVDDVINELEQYEKHEKELAEAKVRMTQFVKGLTNIEKEALIQLIETF